MNCNDFTQHIEAHPADPGSVLEATDLPATLQLDVSDPANPKITLTGDAWVDSSHSSTDEFNLIPRRGAQEDPPEAESEEAPPADDIEGMAANVANVLLNPRWNGKSSHYFDLPLNVTNIELEAGGLPDDIDFAIKVKNQGGGMATVQFRDVNQTLRADNVDIRFAPPAGSSAILSSEGTIRIGGVVQSSGGAITSGGDIRLVGTGSTMTAAQEDGINLYARGDIVLSSLVETNPDSNIWNYKNLSMHGVIYAQGDVQAKIGFHHGSVQEWGDFSLEGALVAYGGNPENNPGTAGDGRAAITAENINLKFDPVYLNQLNTEPPPGPLSKTFYSRR